MTRACLGVGEVGEFLFETTGADPGLGQVQAVCDRAPETESYWHMDLGQDVIERPITDGDLLAGFTQTLESVTDLIRKLSGVDDGVIKASIEATV